MIPKTIHYCWFGRNPKPELIENCIASWHKYCPDWEIVEWNEDNYNVNKNSFMQEAYQCRKWGFVPDYARFDIVYRYGGVYLDTDVELISPIEEFLNVNAFFAFETGRNIACGLGFGADKGHYSMKKCMEYYTSRHFLLNGKMDQTPSPRINTESLIECYPQLRRNGASQIIDNTLFLSPMDYSKHCIHHGTATWVDNKDIKAHGVGNRELKRWLRDPIKFENIEKIMGKKATHVYEFLVYDLLDYGVGYYCRRLLRKLLR